MSSITIDCRDKQPPTRDYGERALSQILIPASRSHDHPTKTGINPNARLLFIGTATTILEWEGFRLMTDPNFLHAGDHVHLGPGVTGTRMTNPAINLEDLPGIDAILLSHYHADHFDQKVEDSLRRDMPIITTPHAKSHLSTKSTDPFTSVHALDVWESLHLNLITHPQTSPTTSITSASSPNPTPHVLITGTPGTHVPPGLLATANSILGAVPPTNGWIIELGYTSTSTSTDNSQTQPKSQPQTPPLPFPPTYRIYISGDTLMFDDIHRIPDLYSTTSGKPIDLMLIHLGGTTIPGPRMPLLMVTMDGKMGVEMMRVVGGPSEGVVTVPIHFDDYDVFLSPLSEFQEAVKEAGLDGQVVYLGRGEEYRFEVTRSGAAS